MSEEITAETVEQLKAADARLRAIDLSAQIEIECQQSKTIALLIAMADEQAQEALGKLADVSPTDTNEIVNLQARVYCAKFIKQTIHDAIRAGIKAEHDIRSEDAEAGDERE